MKTLATILIAGALSVTGAFAGAIPRENAEVKKAAPQLPFRPYQKRPVGTAAASAAPAATVATPKLPFRPYQKRPTAQSSKPNKLEAANRN